MNNIFFRRNQISPLDKAPAIHIGMPITQIMSHVSMVLSSNCTVTDLQEVAQGLEKVKTNLENARSTHSFKNRSTVYASSSLNLYRGFGFKDSLTLVTEALTRVANEEDKKTTLEIESKILSGNFNELIERLNRCPTELIKNRGLIQRYLESNTLNLEIDGLLPLFLDKLSTKDLKSVLSSEVSEEAINKLSKLQILRLSACSNVSNLPPYAQNFREILQPPLDLSDQEISEIAGLTEEEKDAALAHYIEHHTISLKALTLTDERLLRLAPHLRYVDLRSFENIPLAQKLVQKCSNINVLLTNNEKVLEKLALPFCEKLCCGCTMLQALPALPVCKELNCNSSKNLQALPALPLCEKLDCSWCKNLQALPALPLCEKLECKNCRFQALPALPLCKELDCRWSKNLQALPALPLCVMLHCNFCNGLQALPALPLCENLHCMDCKNLQTLPELPLCNTLYCKNCEKLQALPALPLCERLDCSLCTNLITLPLSLGLNRGLTYIDIENTRIDRAVHAAILNQCRMARDAEAIEVLPSRLEKWKAIAKSSAVLDISTLSTEQKKTLVEWMCRLEGTRDFNSSQFQLAHTVCNILTDVLKNKEFQELFFSQAEANNVCCEDRAAMSLNEIYTSWKIICTPVDLPIKEKLKVLTGVAKTLRLRKELQQLVRRNERESVEIFLYYESTLSKRLNLMTAIQNMTYSEIGNRRWIDKEKLVKDVEDKFFEELFELPVFEKMVKHRWEGIDAEFSDKLEQLGDCPEGRSDDLTVLNYHFSQGVIMHQWKKKKMLLAKQWYDSELFRQI